MSFVIEPPPRPSLPVAGGGSFPIRRVFCVGRNYAAHAREMGADPSRAAPFFFMKPADAVVPPGAPVPYPPATSNLHHEVELVVALQGGGAGLDAVAAQALIFGYAAGLDLTRRDLQDVAKAERRPWDMSKGFDASAPCGVLHRAADIGHPARGAIELSVNGELRQRGDLADMIWKVPEVLAHLSTLVRLAPGDLVFTGTPEGVGPLRRGDRVHGRVEGVGGVELTVA